MRRFRTSCLSLALASVCLAGFVSKATAYNVSVDCAAHIGSWVGDSMFGCNLVYTRVPQASLENFKTAFNDCGMRVLRYPGGTVTEATFDYLNSGANGAISLSQFLKFCDTNTPVITPILVVPTTRFSTDWWAGQAYASNFVKAVNVAHTYGYAGKKVKYWEVGNEYWNYPTPKVFTPAQYGDYANKAGDAMLKADATVFPTIQFTPHAGDAPTIASYQLPSAKAVLTHFYPTDFTQATLDSDGVEIANAFNAFGTSPERLITEWNVSMNSTSLDSGMILAGGLPKMLQYMAFAKVTTATMWPLMWQGDSEPNALANLNGTLRPQGQTFKWLSQYARGRWQVDTTPSGPVELTAAYQANSPNNLSVFILCQNMAANTIVRITVNNFAGGNPQVIGAERLSAAGGFAAGAEQSNTPGVIRSVTPNKESNTVFGITGNRYSLYEVIRIDFAP